MLSPLAAHKRETTELGSGNTPSTLHGSILFQTWTYSGPARITGDGVQSLAHIDRATRTEVGLPTVPPSWTVGVISDFNSDGQYDLACRNELYARLFFEIALHQHNLQRPASADQAVLPSEWSALPRRCIPRGSRPSPAALRFLHALRLVFDKEHIRDRPAPPHRRSSQASAIGLPTVAGTTIRNGFLRQDDSGPRCALRARRRFRAPPRA
jgi:hypothetical protein